MGLPPRQPKKTNVSQGIPAKGHRQRAVAVAGEAAGRDHIEAGADQERPKGHLSRLCWPMLILPIAKRVSQPAGNDRHHPLVVADVRFVHAGHGGMADFVGDYPKQVAFKRLRVEVDDADENLSCLRTIPWTEDAELSRSTIRRRA
jgi:hypothetical protein